MSEAARLDRQAVLARRQRDVAAAVDGDVAGWPVVGECLAARAAESTPAFPIRLGAEATVLFLAPVLPSAEVTAPQRASVLFQPAAVLFLAAELPSAEVMAL